MTRRSSLTCALLVLCACSNNDPSHDTDSNPATGTGGMTPGAGGTTPGTGPTPGATAGSSSAGAGAGASAGAGAGAGGMTGADSGTADADADGATADAGDAAMPADARPPANTLKLPVTMEPGGVEPWFNVYRPSDLSATGQPLPVIAWANGGCFRSDFTWAPLFNRWAGAGFVVLALTESPTEGALVQTTVEDQGKLIDWALKQAELPGGPYAGKLDTKRIVAAGNSCGGVTALGLAAKDDRVAAVFVLSGSSALGDSDRAIVGAIAVPVGFVVGSPDEDVANGPANMDYDLLPEGVPAMVVNRSTGDHITVSTDETVLPQDAEIALNWMDLALYGTKEAADALTSPNVCAICSEGMWKLKSKNLEKLQP